MKLGVACKNCKQECPVGVDMARMKLEVTATRDAALGMKMRSRTTSGRPPCCGRISLSYSMAATVRDGGADQAILADGTSCRCQIGDGTGHEALHLALYLDRLADIGSRTGSGS